MNPRVPFKCLNPVWSEQNFLELNLHAHKCWCVWFEQPVQYWICFHFSIRCSVSIFTQLG